MSDSRTQNASRNIIWGVIERISAILMPFIVRTVLIYTLGAEYVGLNSLFSSILQVLSISELGFGSAIVFSMYKPISDNDNKKVCALLKLYRKIYYVVGTIILIVGLGILPFVERLISGTYPCDINIYLLYFFYLLNTVLSYFLFAYKAALFSAYQRTDLISKRNSIVSILLGLSQVVGLVVFRDYYIYVIMILLSTIVSNFLNAWLAKRVFSHAKCEGELQLSEKKELKKRIAGLLSFKIYGVIFSSVDTIVVSVYLGLISLAIFNNYIYIQTAIVGFLNVISTSIIAGIGNKMITNTIDENYKDFLKFSFARGWICSWCSICLLCLYQPFMMLWVGKDLLFPLDTMVLIVLYFFIPQVTNLTFTYREAAGLWWEDRVRPLVASVANLILNIILVQVIGINGVIISTLICSIFINIPWGTHILFKNYFKRGEREYFCRIAYYFFVTLIAGTICYYMCNSIYGGTLQIIVNLMLCTIIPNFVFIVFYHKLPEYDLMNSMIKNILKNRLGV